MGLPAAEEFDEAGDGCGDEDDDGEDDLPGFHDDSFGRRQDAVIVPKEPGYWGGCGRIVSTDPSDRTPDAVPILLHGLRAP